jgi:hypothetical protein
MLAKDCGLLFVGGLNSAFGEIKVSFKSQLSLPVLFRN